MIVVTLFASGLCLGETELQFDVPVSDTIESSPDTKIYFIQVTGSEPLFVHLDRLNGGMKGLLWTSAL
jgi:hypothetical protein